MRGKRLPGAIDGPHRHCRRRTVRAGPGVPVGAARPDAEVLVLEESDRVGGKIQTLQRAGFRIEAGPNGFLDSKPAALDLSREIGLAEQLTAASEVSGRNRFLFLHGRLHKLPGSLFSFLTSRLVSWRAKWRILTERWRSPRLDPADESIASFAARRVGPEIAATLADAFVTGIYAGDPTLLSVQSCFPRLVDWERQHGSVLRGLAAVRKQRRAEARARGEGTPSRARLWSFREGLGLLIDTLRQRLRRPPLVGVAVRRVHCSAGPGSRCREPSGTSDSRRESLGPARLAEPPEVGAARLAAPAIPCGNRPVRLGSPDLPCWQVEAEGKDRWSAEAVVLTCPAYQQAALLTDLDAELADKIAEVRYNRIAVVAVGYRAQDMHLDLNGFGYLTPQRDRLDVLGVQWCSSIYPERAPAGMVLLRALCGGWNRPELVDWDDQHLLQAVRADLARSMAIRADPVFHHIVRWDRAIPQYHLGHPERVAWIEQRRQSYPGLHLGGNAYRGVAINDCIEQADLLADQVLRELPS